MGRLPESQALLQYADDHSADDVDQHDQKTGDGVAAHEFRGAVHRAEEAGLVLQILASSPRFLLVDQAGGEIGIDGHLLAGHGIEVETRRHFCDATRAFGDDHEVHDHQNREHDDADDEVAAHDKMAERLDDVAGGSCSFMPVSQDEPRRGEIEREPQHGGDQQHGRKRGELERGLDEQSRHQDQNRKGDRDGERKIEQYRRQRQDEDHEYGHHADREPDVAPPQHGPEVAQSRERQGSFAALC